MPLAFSHDPWLVAASLLVALIAGFTGLSLTNGLSSKSVVQRKTSVALAAISLGGGIWSMHFVAMLGLRLPIVYYYDAAITLASALIAILVVGLALLVLHFLDRTPATLVAAGCIVGVGVLAMHYLGMAGLELCRAIYTPAGVALAVAASCVLSTAAFRVAYGKRNHRNILIGTACFGAAVFTVHFVAIYGTTFVAETVSAGVGPQIGNETLAIGVVLTTFALCGAFLLTGVTFLSPQAKKPTEPAPLAVELAPAPRRGQATQIPYEREGRTLFVDLGAVAAIRAEGHYTHVYTQAGRHFCAWSITEAERRLIGTDFLKTHRSYLINPAHISGFERHKDNGVCHLDIAALQSVPVSRARLKDVRDALGI